MWSVKSWYEQTKAEAQANSHYHRDMAEHVLKMYMENLQVSRLEMTRLLEQANRQRLEAVPSFDTYPELRGMPELVAAQWRGLREGAGLDDAQAAVLANGLWYYHRCVSGLKAKPKANCSWVFFPTSDHGPLLGNNLDTSPDEPFGPPTWPMINEHVFMGGVSSGVFLDEESPEIFPAPVFKLVERYCRSTDETVEMLTRYNHFWGPGNLLVADRQRKVAMIEKTACRIAVRRSPDGFGFVTAMTAQDPEMNRYLAGRRLASLTGRSLPNPCNDTRYWDAQDTRRSIMNRLLDEARKAPTLDKMQALMQYRGKDGVVCDNGDVLFPGDLPIEHTIRTQVISLSEGRALWWTRDNQRNIPSWENRRQDILFPEGLLWDK